MVTNVDAGDTAWILMCSALVFLMVPGLALFYTGLLRRKNILSIPMFCFLAVCLVTLQWVLVGYSLALGPDHNGWTGTLAWIGLRGVGAEPNLEYIWSVPHLALMIFRSMAAIIVIIIFLAPFVERLKTSALILIALFWSTFVFDPIAHWIWGVGGFLRNAAVFDFAGGAVVHMNAGIAAFTLMKVIGKSEVPPSGDPAESHLPLAVLGTGILWMGWLGLNTGNALTARDVAANAFAMSQIAASTSGLVWMLLDRLLNQKISPLGILLGVTAGLVAISAGADHIHLRGALIIGVGAAVFCYGALAFMRKRMMDDESLYPFGIFGIAGFWGMLGASIGGPSGQFLIQLKSCLSITIYSLGMSYLLFKALDLLIGLTPSEK